MVGRGTIFWRAAVALVAAPTAVLILGRALWRDRTPLMLRFAAGSFL